MDIIRWLGNKQFRMTLGVYNYFVVFRNSNFKRKKIVRLTIFYFFDISFNILVYIELFTLKNNLLRKNPRRKTPPQRCKTNIDVVSVIET